MKKIFVSVSCIVIFLSTSVYSIQLTAVNLGNNQIAIGYVSSGSNVPIGFGLNLTLTDGATFESVVSTSPHFPLFPGTIAINMFGNVTDWGTPVSPMGYPGSLGGIGTSGITLELAANISSQYQEYTDLNMDSIVDYKDLSILVNNWLVSVDPTPENILPDGDINGDYRVDMADLAVFSDSQGIPLGLLRLIVLQVDLNGATNPVLNIAPESTYRGGIVANDGSTFSVEPFSFIIPEPCTLILISIGGIILRNRQSHKI
jgi:hypothetical protein